MTSNIKSSSGCAAVETSPSRPKAVDTRQQHQAGSARHMRPRGIQTEVMQVVCISEDKVGRSCPAGQASSCLGDRRRRTWAAAPCCARGARLGRALHQRSNEHCKARLVAGSPCRALPGHIGPHREGSAARPACAQTGAGGTSCRHPKVPAPGLASQERGGGTRQRDGTPDGAGGFRPRRSRRGFGHPIPSHEARRLGSPPRQPCCFLLLRHLQGLPAPQSQVVNALSTLRHTCELLTGRQARPRGTLLPVLAAQRAAVRAWPPDR